MADRDAVLGALAARAAALLGPIRAARAVDWDTCGEVRVQRQPGEIEETIAHTPLVRDAERLAGMVQICVDLVAAMAPPEAKEPPA